MQVQKVQKSAFIRIYLLLILNLANQSFLWKKNVYDYKTKISISDSV